jgi:hypothetical protein
MSPSEDDRQTRIDRLAASARQRTVRAEQHAEHAIRRMLRNAEAITFRGVHRGSGLSLDFLYTNPAIRARIEAARDAQNNRAVTRQPSSIPDDSAGTVARVLTAQLQAEKRKYHLDIEQLRTQLATATGEVLVLRDQLRAIDGRPR